jgi:multisubunit Na+/H+ antiporter MnhG subunit
MSTTAEAITLIAFVLMALAPMIAAFAVDKGRTALSLVGAGGWLILGVYCYTSHVTTWDIMYSVFWLAMIMVVACVYLAVIMREKKEDEATLEEDPTVANIRELEEDRDRHSQIFRPRGKRPVPSKFSKTGRI